jgi:AbrB family looped-hinge helix DNA binding protein
MSAPLIKEIATITAKGQTTLPKAVRQALSVGPGDKIAYEIDPAGKVIVTRETGERPRYTLEAPLSQCDASAAVSDQDKAWLEDRQTGNELI